MTCANKFQDAFGRASNALIIISDGRAAGAHFCVKVFSETDFTEDPKKFHIPTLILHGDDDRIVPFADAAMLSSKLVTNSRLKIIKGAPHGVCTTHKDEINAELLAFIKA
jgi:non-heme chloroperoxidase